MARLPTTGSRHRRGCQRRETPAARDSDGERLRRHRLRRHRRAANGKPTPADSRSQQRIRQLPAGKKTTTGSENHGEKAPTPRELGMINTYRIGDHRVSTAGLPTGREPITGRYPPRGDDSGHMNEELMA
ncbi:hypothetical protein GCM10009539_11040 [Cryptosporangium japonicum]|uniref:Uncharacterized protein n=1 Tax=Cryptosporangium japonicum TaxID=80872 RepID=A0ABP3DAA9_9ACTN